MRVVGVATSHTMTQLGAAHAVVNDLRQVEVVSVSAPGNAAEKAGLRVRIRAALH
jgi:hypothetical protein